MKMIRWAADSPRAEPQMVGLPGEANVVITPRARILGAGMEATHRVDVEYSVDGDRVLFRHQGNLQPRVTVRNAGTLAFTLRSLPSQALTIVSNANDLDSFPISVTLTVRDDTDFGPSTRSVRLAVQASVGTGAEVPS